MPVQALLAMTDGQGRGRNARKSVQRALLTTITGLSRPALARAGPRVSGLNAFGGDLNQIAGLRLESVAARRLSWSARHCYVQLWCANIVLASVGVSFWRRCT